MVFQIALGVLMIIYALGHAMKLPMFLGRKAKNMDRDARKKYYKDMVAPFLGLGILFLGLTFLTEAGIIGTTMFMVLFIVLVLPLLIWIFVLQKRHVGYYFEWSN